MGKAAEPRGWWKYHRKMESDAMFGTLDGWVFILLLNRTNYEASMTMEGHIVARGQCVASVRGIAEKLHATREQVVAALRRLEKSGSIKTEGTIARRYALFTIPNWDKYQGPSEASEMAENTHQGTHQGTHQEIKPGAGPEAWEHTREHTSLHTYQRIYKNNRDNTVVLSDGCQGQLLDENDLAADDEVGQEAIKPKGKGRGPATPYAEIVTLFNEICTGLPPAKGLPTYRKRLIYHAWNRIRQEAPEGPVDLLREVFARANMDGYALRKQFNLDSILSSRYLTSLLEARGGPGPARTEQKPPAYGGRDRDRRSDEILDRYLKQNEGEGEIIEAGIITDGNPGSGDTQDLALIVPRPVRG